MSEYRKLKADVKARWLKALRGGYKSRQYRQGKEYLRRDDKFCCLGVLCDLSRLQDWSKAEDAGVMKYGKKAEEMPPPMVYRWAKLDPQAANDLAELNDNGKRFPYIAKWIEENL